MGQGKATAQRLVAAVAAALVAAVAATCAPALPRKPIELSSRCRMALMVRTMHARAANALWCCMQLAAGGGR